MGGSSRFGLEFATPGDTTPKYIKGEPRNTLALFISEVIARFTKRMDGYLVRWVCLHYLERVAHVLLCSSLTLFLASSGSLAVLAGPEAGLAVWVFLRVAKTR